MNFCKQFCSLNKLKFSIFRTQLYILLEREYISNCGYNIILVLTTVRVYRDFCSYTKFKFYNFPSSVTTKTYFELSTLKAFVALARMREKFYRWKTFKFYNIIDKQFQLTCFRDNNTFQTNRPPNIW